MEDQKKKKNKGGRPTMYNDDLGEMICSLMACHSYSLQRLCDTYDALPASAHTIHKWRYKHPEFNIKYFSAKQHQQDLLVENLNEEMHEDILYYYDSDGNKRIDSPSMALAQAKANNKKWAASKLKPKTYGDAKQLEIKTEENEQLKEELLKLRLELAEKNSREY